MKLDLNNVLLYTKEPNINGISYSDEARQSMIEQINSKETLGTFPDRYKDVSEVDLSKVSHRVFNARMDENGNVVASIEILKTDHGKVLQRVIDSKYPIKFSAVGAGYPDQNNFVEEYTLINVTALTIASARKSRTKSIDQFRDEISNAVGNSFINFCSGYFSQEEIELYFQEMYDDIGLWKIIRKDAKKTLRQKRRM